MAATTATTQETLPSSVPDFSCVKDFVSEADARVFNGEEEPSSPNDTDNLPPEFRGLEERLQEMRKAPRKVTNSTPKEKAEGEEDEPLRALYFVRIPKPDMDSPTYDLLQQEFEAQLAQVKIYVEERRVQTLKKNEARKDTNKALTCLKEANERVNEQRRALNPYREQRAEDRKARAALKDSKRGVAATTERELDNLIRRLEFRMEHETIPLSEEKELHQEIKRLKASRPHVREIERKDAEHAAMMTRRDLSPSNKEHMEKELKEYRAEQSMYEKMYKDLRAIERDVDTQLQQICSQLDAAAKKKDAIYEKLAAARGRRRMLKNAWQRNRTFSRHINDLVTEKKIEEAQAECMEQTDLVMRMLISNVEYRNEYLTLWSVKRSNPMAVFEEGTAEKKKSSAKPAKKASSLHANVKVLPGQSLPEAVVANTLREATEKRQGKQHKEEKKTVKKVDVPSENETVSAKPEILEKPNAKPSPAPETSKPKKVPVHDGFELPAVIAAEKTKGETAAMKEGGDSQQKEKKAAEAVRPELAERQRLERIEAQKKKKAEQARKKKMKEEEQKEAEAKPPRETIVKAPPSQPKKQPSHSKKQTRSRGATHVFGNKTGTPMPRPGKRKNKSEFEKIMQFLKQYPILVISVIVFVCTAIIYAALF